MSFLSRLGSSETECDPCCKSLTQCPERLNVNNRPLRPIELFAQWTGHHSVAGMLAILITHSEPKPMSIQVCTANDFMRRKLITLQPDTKVLVGVTQLLKENISGAP